jgi:zeaxanthin glucosyltransferase
MSLVKTLSRRGHSVPEWPNSTLQNHKWKNLHKIAEACAELDVQLVISLGNPNDQEVGFSLPGLPLVVPYAPHQQLIERTSVVITHAGTNTVLGALSNGVPIVAIPINYEQPGIAARLLRTGAGEVIPKSRSSVSKLRSAIKKVLTQDSYKKNPSRLQEAIHRAGDVSLSAHVVEQAISIGKPTLTNVNG